MKKTIYLNEERLYRLVEEVLLELSKHAAPRLPIIDINGEKLFEWDDSKENRYTLVALKPFDETDMNPTLKPLLEYFIGVMKNKIHEFIRRTNKDAAIVILFPTDNIKMTIRFFFTYDATFNFNGRNRTINTIRNVRIKPGGFEFRVYKNDVLSSKIVDRNKREWANNLFELVKANLGRLEEG